MKLDPRAIVELLQRLEQQCADHRPHLADVALALSKSDFERALEVAGNLHSVLEGIISTRARLRDYIVSLDGLGEPGSLIELAIRGRRVVIRMQASRLQEAFREVAMGRTSGWFVGKFRRIDDVIAFLNEVVEGSRVWEIYRDGQPLPAGMKEIDRVTMYRTTLGIAQRSIRRLGADPDLEHFLKGGVAAVDWHEVHTGCKQIAGALAGEIDLDVDAGAFAQGPGPRASNTAAGTP
jgi:hypothetical protein